MNTPDLTAVRRRVLFLIGKELYDKYGRHFVALSGKALLNVDFENDLRLLPAERARIAHVLAEAIRIYNPEFTWEPDVHGHPSSIAEALALVFRLVGLDSAEAYRPTSEDERWISVTINSQVVDTRPPTVPKPVTKQPNRRRASREEVELAS